MCSTVHNAADPAPLDDEEMALLDDNFDADGFDSDDSESDDDADSDGDDGSAGSPQPDDSSPQPRPAGSQRQCLNCKSFFAASPCSKDASLDKFFCLDCEDGEAHRMWKVCQACAAAAVAAAAPATIVGAAGDAPAPAGDDDAPDGDDDAILRRHRGRRLRLFVQCMTRTHLPNQGQPACERASCVLALRHDLNSAYTKASDPTAAANRANEHLIFDWVYSRNGHKQKWQRVCRVCHVLVLAVWSTTRKI